MEWDGFVILIIYSDNYLEQSFGGTPVSRIFYEYGEHFFRDNEVCHDSIISIASLLQIFLSRAKKKHFYLQFLLVFS